MYDCFGYTKTNAKLARANKAKELYDVCVKGCTSDGQPVPVLPAFVQEMFFIDSVNKVHIANPVYPVSALNVVLKQNTIQDILFQNRAENKRILVLNFANYIYPGGGFLNGALAQEEALCSVSNLYFLLSHLGSSYYLRHRTNLPHLDSVCRHLYGNESLFTSQVSLISNEDGSFITQEPYGFDVLTTAAPNFRQLLNSNIDKSLATYHGLKTMASRIDHIMACILNLPYTYDRIILGAFGCGVFGNNAEYVAALFKQYLADMQKYHEYCNFKEVQFVMPDDTNFNKFKKVLKG